ncbi:MAG TPA: RDD family protein, partial [Candidatus Kapabacteria bacterium]
FWRRAVALAIDLLVIALLSGILMEPTAMALGGREASDVLHKVPFATFVLRTYGVWAILTLVLAWLYSAAMESSRFHATIGKRIMGLMVLTSDEARLDFWRASRRFWMKIISGALAFGGFFLFFFDTKQRSLHDLLARTIVVQAHPKLIIE